MSKIWLSAVALASIVATTIPASAQSRGVRAGGLPCRSGTPVGMIIGSRQNLRCTFHSNRTGKNYAYTGTVRRFGLDVGITSGARFAWAVFAPVSHVGRASLRGNYVGASGSASFGPGVGANVLVGGSNNTISLQSLSVEGRPGVNLALGVANLSLR